MRSEATQSCTGELGDYGTLNVDQQGGSGEADVRLPAAFYEPW